MDKSMACSFWGDMYHLAISKTACGFCCLPYFAEQNVPIDIRAHAAHNHVSCLFCLVVFKRLCAQAHCLLHISWPVCKFALNGMPKLHIPYPVHAVAILPFAVDSCWSEDSDYTKKDFCCPCQVDNRIMTVCLSGV